MMSKLAEYHNEYHLSHAFISALIGSDALFDIESKQAEFNGDTACTFGECMDFFTLSAEPTIAGSDEKVKIVLCYKGEYQSIDKEPESKYEPTAHLDFIGAKIYGMEKV